jgi:hypothetical protein
MKKLILAAVLFTAIFTSCKKEDCPVVTPVVPTYPIEGLWIGNYGNGTSVPSAYYSFIIKPGGIFTVEANSATSPIIAVGTWTLAGSTLNCTYTYLSPSSGTYSATASFSNSGTLTSGTWGSGASATGGGTWNMTRKN